MRTALTLPLLVLLFAATPVHADGDCEARAPTAAETQLLQALRKAARLLPAAPAGWHGEDPAEIEETFCKNVNYADEPKLLATSAKYLRMDSEEQAARNAEAIAAAMQKHGGQPPQELMDRLFNIDRVADVRIELNPASASCAGERRALQVAKAQAAWLCQIGWNQDRQDDQVQGETRYNAQIVVLYGPWRSEKSADELAFSANFKPGAPYTAVQTASLSIHADQDRAEALLKAIDSAAIAALLSAGK